MIGVKAGVWDGMYCLALHQNSALWGGTCSKRAPRLGVLVSSQISKAEDTKVKPNYLSTMALSLSQ